MTTMQSPLDAWLNQTAANLTQEEEDLIRTLSTDQVWDDEGRIVSTSQVDRFLAEAKNIDTRYPDDDGAYMQDRKHAYVITAQMLTGRIEADLTCIHIELIASKVAARRVWVRASHAARLAVLLHKTPEAEAAREVGIDRGTLRRMLDKQPARMNRKHGPDFSDPD